MRALTILALLLVASKFATALAHVAEAPGKLRLDEAQYRATQTIYYPGFTLVGLVGEVGGMIALAALLFLAPAGGARFWWTAAALGFLAAGHATYWLMTHPVNKEWVRDVALSAPGSAFFSASERAAQGDWTALRDRWEWSHAVIAVFATLALVSIAVALSLLGAEG